MYWPNLAVLKNGVSLLEPMSAAAGRTPCPSECTYHVQILCFPMTLHAGIPLFPITPVCLHTYAHWGTMEPLLEPFTGSFIKLEVPFVVEGGCHTLQPLLDLCYVVFTVAPALQDCSARPRAHQT